MNLGPYSNQKQIRQARRQTFGEIPEMADQMEQTQNEIPLLTEMPNVADETKNNDLHTYSDNQSSNS